MGAVAPRFASALAVALGVLVVTTASSSGCGSGGDPDAGAVASSSGLPGFGDAGIPPRFGDSNDPLTCADAKNAHSYVGCDYWPTVTGNIVWSLFDFAVVVSNVGTLAADVTVTGPDGTHQNATVAPGSLAKIYLPWVRDLKGEDANKNGEAVALAGSVLSVGGAYHLVSSAPVVVYQFSALEYAPAGGPPGKSWTPCPGAGSIPCFSYTNDASLLLPSTAWTQSYRVTGVPGWSAMGQDIEGGYVVITAAQNGTNVTVALSPKGKVMAGGGTPATDGSGTVTRILNAGDALELVTPVGDAYDLSGSLVTSDKPVQVITGIPCINVPSDKEACDHVEESVVPAESLGKEYVVTTPSRPKGGPGIHDVRLYGNRDGTTLTYAPSRPGTCPLTLDAGQVVDCGLVETDFVVRGSQEFGIASLTVGADVYDPTRADSRGDPDQTIYASTEQYRTAYLFLAPDDYDVSYAVISGPEAANPVLDGRKLAALVGSKTVGSGYAVWRAALGLGGSHTLTSDLPIGLQVMGYGANTSYTYPGGLNLKRIAPPPPPVK